MRGNVPPSSITSVVGRITLLHTTGMRRAGRPIFRGATWPPEAAPRRALARLPQRITIFMDGQREPPKLEVSLTGPHGRPPQRFQIGAAGGWIGRGRDCEIKIGDGAADSSLEIRPDLSAMAKWDPDRGSAREALLGGPARRSQENMSRRAGRGRRCIRQGNHEGRRGSQHKLPEHRQHHDRRDNHLTRIRGMPTEFIL